MEETFWYFFKTEDGTRWQLVLCRGYSGSRPAPIWKPGYESKESGDIIQAVLYLEQGFRGRRLTDRMVSILQGIKDEAESLGYLEKNNKERR